MDKRIIVLQSSVHINATGIFPEQATDLLKRGKQFVLAEMSVMCIGTVML